MRVLLCALLALTGGCLFGDDATEEFWSGGAVLSGGGSLLESTDGIWAVSSGREPYLELTITRCSETPWRMPGLSGEYNDWYRRTGQCDGGPSPIAPEGPLPAGEVGVEVWYECAAGRSTTTRVSMRSAADSRLEGEFTGTDDTCADDAETWLRIRYFRVTSGYDLQYHAQGTYWDSGA